MASARDVELVKCYAPILWLHESEAFFPEDCSSMAQIAQIGKPNKKLEEFTLERLGDLRESEKYHMDIQEVDYNNFCIDSSLITSELGPDCISEHFRQKFSNNPRLYPNARQAVPKCFGRVTHVNIEYRDREPFSKFFESLEPEVFGEYDVVQYFFFYLFNDAWNKHIGDWDSTLEVFVKKDGSRRYAIYHMHHVTWMADFNENPTDLNAWIDDWREAEKDKKMGKVFHINFHPFIFVAKGAHGGYPTPGFSVHGLKLIKNVIGQTDCRQIGKICIYPHEAVTEDLIQNVLTYANIDDQPDFFKWSEIIILENQPWLKYKGYWGTKSKYDGWSGPTGPAQKSYWQANQMEFKNIFSYARKGDYRGEWILKIFKNWHGWKCCPKTA